MTVSGRIFLITWHDDFRAAVERHIRHAFAYHQEEKVFEPYVVPEKFSFKDVLEAYQHISAFMEAKAGPGDLRQSAAILDLPLHHLARLDIKPDPLSITEQKKNPAVTLAGMLAFTFPEVHWSFFTSGRAGPPGSGVDALDQHILSAEMLGEVTTRAGNFSPLFDYSGLRNYIRECVNGNPDAGGALALPLRDNLCAAIDDEEPYAFVHSYVAYKLGYRCYVVTNEATMDAALTEAAEVPLGAPGRQPVEITFEDMFLNFPDRESSAQHLSNISQRDQIYQSLQQVAYRLFVTVGHKHIRWHEDNREHLDGLRMAGKTVRIIYKPTGGIYNILKNGKLLNRYWRRRDQELEAVKPTSGGRLAAGHGAPGRLLIIAERLISRANRILNDAQTVQDCVHGATLALEAQELLGYRTPTTSLEAIALRHRLEVKAECMFYGIGYTKDVKQRLREICLEVEAVARWFHPSLRKPSALNAQMSIVTEIIRIFRDYGQFDEEQQCLNHLRKLHRRSGFWRRPWLGPLYPIRWYVETLVGSFPLFIVAILVWPVIFGAVAWKINWLTGTGKHHAFNDFVAHSYIMFFGLQPLDFPGVVQDQSFTLFVILMGFTHLGIFISHLYTLISRR